LFEKSGRKTRLNLEQNRPRGRLKKITRRAK
jgi:hypothetical protein